jgi:hypothetical protein
MIRLCEIGFKRSKIITCGMWMRLNSFLELTNLFIMTIRICKPSLAMLFLFDKF